MKKFIYYSKNDPTKEPHGHVMARNIRGAIIKASKLKQLEIDGFHKLFNIEEKKG